MPKTRALSPKKRAFLEKVKDIRRRIRRSGRHQLWTGATRWEDGKPIVVRDGKTMLVAKMLWEEENGPVPVGRKLRRINCDRDLCVAPGCRGLT